MRKFLIKVNGNQYEVEVEEVKDENKPVQAQAVAAPETQVTETAATSSKKESPSTVGALKVTAPMPGTILSIAVNTGDAVKKGQVLLVLEAMKMENEIVAPADGRIVSVDVAKGASVNAGDILVTLDNV